VASNLLVGLAPEAAKLLKDFKSSDAAIVSLGFGTYESNSDILEQAGSGVIVPVSESKSIRGITLSSRKWINRSPEAQLLVRVFGREGVFEKLSKEEAIKLALSELERLLSVKGELLYSDLHLWKMGSAQCGVGHREKVANVKSALKEYPGIFLLGAPYGGVGIGDCIQSAKRVAQEVLDYIQQDT
jgi:oxygen-dependent protoporphyrinogen oxidase